MKGIPGKEYEPTCPGCGHPVSEHRYNFICQHEGCYCSLTPADLQPKVEPAEKRYMVIVEGKQTPHYVHTNLKHAKNEAERLCTKEQRKTQVIEVIPIGHWETSHLSIWHEEQYMIKYFHELTKEEFAEIVKSHEGQDYTWAKCAKDYPQPEWCSYPDAVCAMMGCWSLMDHLVTGRSFCKKCDLYIPKKKRGSK